jgi:hypothetical protein
MAGAGDDGALGERWWMWGERQQLWVGGGGASGDHCERAASMIVGGAGGG